MPVPAGGVVLAHSAPASPLMLLTTQAVPSPLTSSLNTVLAVVPLGQVPGAPVVKERVAEFRPTPQAFMPRTRQW